MGMTKIPTLMQKILAFELKRIAEYDFDAVSSMPNYCDRKRGPFVVSYWHEQKCENVACLIVQVYFYRCLGMATTCVGGMSFSPEGKRLLSMKEMTAYF